MIVVCGHPSQQDEGAPVVAEVAEDEGPDRALGEDLFPGHLGAFPLQSGKDRSHILTGQR